MEKISSLSTEKLVHIVSFHIKLFAQEIAKQLKISKTAVHNAIKKFKIQCIFKKKKRSPCQRGMTALLRRW